MAIRAPWTVIKMVLQYDIGAYEYTGVYIPPLLCDFDEDGDIDGKDLAEFAETSFTESEVKKFAEKFGDVSEGFVRVMGINKSTKTAQDFSSYSRRAKGSILEYVPFSATKKTS